MQASSRTAAPWRGRFIAAIEYTDKARQVGGTVIAAAKAADAKVAVRVARVGDTSITMAL